MRYAALAALLLASCSEPSAHGEAAPPAATPAALEGGAGASLDGAAGAAAQAAPSPDCALELAPLTVELVVLLRHPTDKVAPLPESGYTLFVDAVPHAAPWKVGAPDRLCLPPGEHALEVRDGDRVVRSVKATAPGAAKIPVATGTPGTPPGLPPGFGPKLPAPPTPPTGG